MVYSLYFDKDKAKKKNFFQNNNLHLLKIQKKSNFLLIFRI